MKKIALLLAVAGAAVAVPALAQDYHQQDPNQPWNDGSAGASQEVAPGDVAPGRDPGTHRLNQALAGQAVRDAQDQRDAQHVYHDEQMDRRQVMAQQDRMAFEQRRRYEMALQDWRARDAACRNGDRDACGGPAPYDRQAEGYGRGYDDQRQGRGPGYVYDGAQPSYGQSDGRGPQLPYALNDPNEAYPAYPR